MFPPRRQSFLTDRRFSELPNEIRKRLERAASQSNRESHQQRKISVENTSNSPKPFITFKVELEAKISRHSRDAVLISFLFLWLTVLFPCFVFRLLPRCSIIAAAGGREGGRGVRVYSGHCLCCHHPFSSLSPFFSGPDARRSKKATLIPSSSASSASLAAGKATQAHWQFLTRERQAAPAQPGERERERCWLRMPGKRKRKTVCVLKHWLVLICAQHMRVRE